jgi:predicted NBD/HSP70 family sugar kinase
LAPTDDPVAREQQVEELAALGRAGNAGIRTLFENVGHQIGRSLGNLVSVIDPARIIFAGPTMGAADLWFDAMRKALVATTRPPMAERIELIREKIADDRWARGAAALVLDRLYRTEQAPNGSAARQRRRESRLNASV